MATKDIFKIVNGKMLLVIIDKKNDEGSLAITKSGIVYDKDSESSIVQYKLATVTEIGDHGEMNKYTVGDRVMLLPETKERPLKINGKYGDLIHNGVVIGILDEAE